MRQDVKPERSADPAALVLGYFNFSSGTFDPAAWRAMSDLFAALETGAGGPEGADTAQAVAGLLRERLGVLQASEPAFRDARQAERLLEILFGELLPAYRTFHADLLEHQPPGALERPFFLMAAAAALLAAGGQDDTAEVSVLVAQALAQLNDYVGWRPVAVLENGQLSEPYPHERVRPIPLFMAGAGAAQGRYRELVAGAIEILASAPQSLLQQADFDLAMLEELAIDPRAFDFLHPAASRPNYLFGLWDPSRIDERGCYRRMVVQQATLDGILSWPQAAAGTGSSDAKIEAQLRWESAAVLAGVMLMASGLSGHGPGSHQASLPLSELLPRIAGYRDEFYRWMMAQLPEEHSQRLQEEMLRLRQPFGGVRRHINTLLASRRAMQVESVSLAGVFARVGRAEAADRMAARVPAASARMLAKITSRVVAAQQALRAAGERSNPELALEQLDAATDLLFRAVGCGAAVDPWNILGLGGQFPLHDSGGESLPDPRVDDLIGLTGTILAGYAAVWRASSLDGPPAAARRAGVSLERLAVWWDRHATTTVSGVQHLSGRELLDSAREVIGALQRRRQTAPAVPPPGFWRTEVAEFSSPNSHAQAAAALLREGDLDGAMGLLVHWASLLEGSAVERSGPEWLAAASRWFAAAIVDTGEAGRSRVRRFLELVEANTIAVADCIQRVASHGPGDGTRRRSPATEEDDTDPADEAPDAEERVAAAYESMVWHDSADDGTDGGMLDVEGAGGGSAGGMIEVENAAEFLGGVCRLLRHAMTALSAQDVAAGNAPSPGEIDSVIGWRHVLRRLKRTMVRAAAIIISTETVPPLGMPAAEFDRLAWQRDSAAERLIDAAVQATETLWMLSARLHIGTPPARPGAEHKTAVGRLFAALLAGDAAAARGPLEVVRDKLMGQPVLYVPLSRGGRPDRIVRARSRERLLERLAACLPRLGLVTETSNIVLLAKALENRRPRGAASVSEFDRVFEAGTSALVERIVESARQPAEGEAEPTAEVVKERILDGLSLLVPRLLDTWMTHARQLRLSVLERVRDQKAFTGLQEFIEKYGSGLFTQHLLAPSSLRGILRGGVRRFLEQLVERHTDEHFGIGEGTAARQPTRLVEALSSGTLPARQAAARLRLILESIAENHAEYRDWNSTTTQSDRGETLHILLDMLRIKAEYERIAWTLRPVGMAHRVLANCGMTEAAAAWRGRMRDETRDTAAELVGRLSGLESQWGIRLASVGDRVRRPFTAVLEQDELESRVEPAVAELMSGSPPGAGAAFEENATALVGLAGGSGVELPEWLDRLGHAVDRALEQAEIGISAQTPPGSLPAAVPWRPLAWDALRKALS